MPMQNAHLRLGLLEYHRITEKTSTRIRVRVPAVPEWAEHVCGVLEAEGRFQPLHGIGCEPVLVTATADEMLAWISSALKSCEIAFPEENGPVKWPKHALFEALRQTREEDEQ
jgi:hypothetical protein